MKQPNSSFNQNVKIVSFCPMCGTKFNINNAVVVDEREDAQMVHISCNKCNSSIIAVITFNQMGINSIGIISDLSRPEVEKFQQSVPVCSDDVIEFHKVLKKKDITKILNL